MTDKECSNRIIQREELEALSSIYGDDFVFEDEEGMTFSILIQVGSQEGEEATLVITFCEDYPKSSPPIFHLSVPWLRGAEKHSLSKALENLYKDNAGKCIVYDWVEKLRELLVENTPNKFEPPNVKSITSKTSHDVPEQGPPSLELPKFVTGEPLVDRKSTFQAHVVTVSNPSYIRPLIDQLLENKRISSATHNMFAYRIYNDLNKTWYEDCDDDGETHGGTRLLHLLQILQCRDVMIVVSRWFGGILLYGDRFKHINNVARKLLKDEGYVSQSSSFKSAKIA